MTRLRHAYTVGRDGNWTPPHTTPWLRWEFLHMGDSKANGRGFWTWMNYDWTEWAGGPHLSRYFLSQPFLLDPQDMAAIISSSLEVSR